MSSTSSLRTDLWTLGRPVFSMNLCLAQSILHWNQTPKICPVQIDSSSRPFLFSSQPQRRRDAARSVLSVRWRQSSRSVRGSARKPIIDDSSKKDDMTRNPYHFCKNVVYMAVTPPNKQREDIVDYGDGKDQISNASDVGVDHDACLRNITEGLGNPMIATRSRKAWR